MARVPNVVENCRKFQPAEWGAQASVRDGQTTDGRATAYVTFARKRQPVPMLASQVHCSVAELTCGAGGAVIVDIYNLHLLQGFIAALDNYFV